MPLGLAVEQAWKVVVIWVSENTLWDMSVDGAAWVVWKLYKDCEATRQVGRVLEVVGMLGAEQFVRPIRVLTCVIALLSGGIEDMYSPIGMNLK